MQSGPSQEVYLTQVYTIYELVFVRLELGLRKDDVLKSYAKRRILMKCGLGASKIRALSRKSGELMRVQTRDDVDRLAAGNS